MNSFKKLPSYKVTFSSLFTFCSWVRYLLYNIGTVLSNGAYIINRYVTVTLSLQTGP